MKTLNPDWVKIIQKRVDSCPYLDLLSFELKDLSWGKSRLEIPVEKKHLQLREVVHGGVFASLIDAACFWALYTQAPPGVPLTTAEMKLNYLAPAKQGRLIGLGKSLKLGSTLGLAEARVEDEKGRLLAHGTITVMRLKKPKGLIVDDEPLKYLD